VEAIAKANEHVLCVFVNCAGPKGAKGFAAQHGITKSLHFHQANVPSAFGLKYIPHKVLIAADGTVLKNYSFAGSSLAAEVAKLKA